MQQNHSLLKLHTAYTHIAYDDIYLGTEETFFGQRRRVIQYERELVLTDSAQTRAKRLDAAEEAEKETGVVGAKPTVFIAPRLVDVPLATQIVVTKPAGKSPEAIILKVRISVNCTNIGSACL